MKETTPEGTLFIGSGVIAKGRLMVPAAATINGTVEGELSAQTLRVMNSGVVNGIATAEEIVVAENIPFQLLKPLIVETAAKVQIHAPADMQTGPARRGDIKTIQKHLSFLKKYPDFYQLYETMTELIQKKYKH
jgi:hypothetical protein